MKIDRSDARRIGALCEEQAIKWRMAIESNKGEHSAAENTMTAIEAERFEKISEAFKKGENITIV